MATAMFLGDRRNPSSRGFLLISDLIELLVENSDKLVDDFNQARFLFFAIGYHVSGKRVDPSDFREKKAWRDVADTMRDLGGDEFSEVWFGSENRKTFANKLHAAFLPKRSKETTDKKRDCLHIIVRKFFDLMGIVGKWPFMEDIPLLFKYLSEINIAGDLKVSPELAKRYPNAEIDDTLPVETTPTLMKAHGGTKLLPPLKRRKGEVEKPGSSKRKKDVESVMEEIASKISDAAVSVEEVGLGGPQASSQEVAIIVQDESRVVADLKNHAKLTKTQMKMIDLERKLYVNQGKRIDLESKRAMVDKELEEHQLIEKKIQSEYNLTKVKADLEEENYGVGNMLRKTYSNQISKNDALKSKYPEFIDFVYDVKQWLVNCSGAFKIQSDISRGVNYKDFGLQEMFSQTEISVENDGLTLESADHHVAVEDESNRSPSYKPANVSAEEAATFPGTSGPILSESEDEEHRDLSEMGNESDQLENDGDEEDIISIPPMFSVNNLSAGFQQLIQGTAPGDAEKALDMLKARKNPPVHDETEAAVKMLESINKEFE